MWAFGSLLFFDYRETNASPAISVLTTQNTSRPKAPQAKTISLRKHKNRCTISISCALPRDGCDCMK